MEKLEVALAKVGGLIALLKFISLLLREYHRILFEKDYSPIKERVHSSLDVTETFKQECSFQEVFSFDALKETIENQDLDEKRSENVEQ